MPHEKISAEPLVHWIARNHNGNEAKWCKNFGIDQAVLTNWKRRGVPAGRVAKIAAQMGVTSDEYLAQAGSLPELPLRRQDFGAPKESNDTHGSVTIDRLAARGSMGVGHSLVGADHVVEKITVTTDWVRQWLPRVSSHQNLRVISALGDSMMPTFNDGDMLLVDTGIKAVDLDGVFVLRTNGRLYIKRVRQRLDGTFEVRSDNHLAGTPEELSGKTKVDVLGRVVWAWNGKKL
jgi:hypothetical protein